MIKNFVAFDFETANGKNPCSIGIVEFENGKAINEYYSLIKPKELIFNPFASRIHGIGISDVINEREFVDVWADISHFFDNKIVVAHNYSFDISVLNHSLEIYGIKKPTYEVYCTLKLSRSYLQLKNHKLNSVAKFFKISQNNYHNALEDALVCGKVFFNFFNYAQDINDLKAKGKSGLLLNGKSKNIEIKKMSIQISPNYNVANSINKSNKLDCKIFVVSGVFTHFDRNELKKSIEDNGGKVASAISKKTDFVVAGENMGPSKREKAEELGIPIISETEYLHLIN